MNRYKYLFLLLAPIVMTACLAGSKHEARRIEVEKLVDEIRPRAYVCAPKLLAIAETQVAFSRIESEQGDYHRADGHLKRAEDSAREADLLSDHPKCGANLKTEVHVEKVEVVEAPKLAPQPKDRDGDGILDERDKCPDQPEDYDGYKDDDGCPEPDNDGDGIPDEKDRCPNVAEDRDGYQDEDGCPELDNDGDGINDVIDKCPLQPEDYDGFQDEDGCPELDNDGDGVSDTFDLCPTEAENYNGNKDDDGCPDKDPLAKIEGNKIRLTQKVFFKTGKATILSQSFPLLDEVAEILRDHPKIEIRIEGHTDSRGRASYNLKLSEQRAAAVLDYLADKGVDRSRMDSVGYGPDRPIDDNATEAGRANNRRVEINITKQ